jgi:hypothetical protein
MGDLRCSDSGSTRSKGTELRRGIVQPDFGHTGGGVEVLFDNGTDDGTVSGPKVLPA